MLQAIRERVTGVVAIIVLGLLAIPFAFFGVTNYFNPTPPDTVATVGDEDIKIGDFQRSFNQYRNQMRQRMGENYDPVAMEQPTVRRQHLEDMIDQSLLRQYAEEMGLTVPPTELARIIHEIPQFRIGGRFDQEVYRNALSASGMSISQFERDLRDDILVREIPAALTRSGLATEHEIDRMLRVRGEKRDIRTVTLPAADFREQVEISDEQVETYYNEHPDEFMTPERVAIEYVEIDAADLEPSADSVDEEILRQRYESAQQRYMTPEARRASHILLEVTGERDEEATRELAAELAERARGEEDFAELAREYSDDIGSAEAGGDLGWIEPDDMVEAFEDRLYELETGQVSDPVKTGYGYHVIKLEEIREPRGQSFEEAREEILAEYQAEEGRRIYTEMRDRMIDLVYADPTALGPVAEELDLEIQRTEPFTRSGAQEGIAGNPDVVEAAFSDLVLAEGSTSDPVDVGDDRSVVLRVAEHFPERRRELADVRDQIRERLERERAFELAGEAATELTDATREDPSRFAELAGERGREVNDRDGTTRQDFDLGGDFVSELFALPAPGDSPDVHRIRKSDGWVVVVLDGVTPGDPDGADEAQRQRVARQLEFAHSGYEVAGLVAHLRATRDIEIYEDMLER